MAGFEVDPAELDTASGASRRAGRCLSGVDGVVAAAEQAAPVLGEAGVVELALAVANGAGRTFAEGVAVLGALANGLHAAATGYHAADHTFPTVTVYPDPRVADPYAHGGAPPLTTE